jgi:crossover junction endodeoxyribonuclease RuvC
VIILGIDPGTTGMGYAFLDAAHDPPAVRDCGVVPAPARGSAAERLAAVAAALDGLIAAHAPAALALERLYFNRNVRTAMAVAEARGIALLCAARARLQVAEYTPQEVKLAVAGNGAADKRAVQRMLALLLRLERPITQDNAADAAALALTHAHRLRLAEAVRRAASP